MRFRRRLLLLYLCFCVGILVIWMRATQLQWIDGDVWAQEARRQRETYRRLDPLRGPIVSADGMVLAEDVPVFQLAVVAWDWEHRRRTRCESCGTVHYPRRNGKLPRTCSCERALGRGKGVAGGDDYPRVEGRVEGVPLKRMPDGDLRPLELALELKPGELDRLAQARILYIEKLLVDLRERLTRSEEAGSFLESRIKLRRRDLMHRPFVIASELSGQAVQLVRTNENGDYRGFRVIVTKRRRYPQGDFAPQMVGYTSQLSSEAEYKALRDERRDPVTKQSPVTRRTVRGRTGLERAYDAQLQGEAGFRRLERDASGSFNVVLEERLPSSGPTLGLSVSLAVSRQAEKDLFVAAPAPNYLPAGKPSGGFVLIDVETGAILVWAEAPTFNLNTDLAKIYDPELANPVADREARLWQPRNPLSSGLDLETWRSLLVVPVPPTWSRVAQVAVEPGSTFKPLIALGMLQSGRPLPFALFHCRNDGRLPRCHAPGHGHVDLVSGITRSCNRLFAFSVRDSKYWPVYRHSIAEFMEQLGFGKAPGEVSEWSRGQWLWSSFDFPLSAAVLNAQRRLEQRAEKRAAKRRTEGKTAQGRGVPKILLSLSPGVPATVGGDPTRLGRTLASVAEWVARKSGAETVALHVSRETSAGNQVGLRFGLRAARRPPWFTVPGLGNSEAELPSRLRRRAPSKAGLRGRIERGGTVWFTAGFQRKSGRVDDDAPPVIGAGDGRFVAIGQGPVLVTPLQMARAMAVVANGGRLVSPHLVRSIGSRQISHASRPIPLDPAHLRLVREGMLGVTQNPRGTAYRNGLFDRLPADVYAKTGTAQVGATWRPWATIEGKGPWHHWFVGYAVAPGRRTVAFACVLHSRTEGGAGGTAAPAVRQILEHWYAAPESRIGH